MAVQRQRNAYRGRIRSTLKSCQAKVLSMQRYDTSHPWKGLIASAPGGAVQMQLLFNWFTAMLSLKEDVN